jgi:impB/mucB/samB family
LTILVLLINNDISFCSIQIAEKKIVELEASRDLTKTWLHTDMDAFYAAVEILDNPSLNGKPLAVGSMSMICTASYEVAALLTFVAVTSLYRPKNLSEITAVWADT